LDKLAGPFFFTASQITFTLKNAWCQVNFEAVLPNDLNSCEQSSLIDTSGWCHDADASSGL
jgi:hypothetical protein